MVVVVIIGVLSTMAYPLFSKYQCRAKQSEATTGLKALYIVQDGYRARHDRYIDAAMAPSILFPVLAGKERYDFQIISADATQFTAHAVGEAGGEMEGDTWAVNDVFDLVNLTPNHCL
jgi:Tfp pilus assembly protein PilE